MGLQQEVHGQNVNANDRDPMVFVKEADIMVRNYKQRIQNASAEARKAETQALVTELI